MTDNKNITDKEKTPSVKLKPVNAEAKIKTKAASVATGRRKVNSSQEAVKATKKKAATKKTDVKRTMAEIKAADDAIKSQKSIDSLKARAREAKLRAQKKILEKSFVSDPPVDPLERLANTFHQSARRWEMVVYPSLFAFILLAGYGFFLIYRLTHDISILSRSVTRMATIVSDSIPKMTQDMGVMTGSMNHMTNNIQSMSGDVKKMTTEINAMSGQMNTLTPLSKNISNMTGTMNEMNRSVYGMQRSMGGMNRTISSGPLGMMNDMMPMSSRTNVMPRLPPPTYRQPWEIRRPYLRKPVPAPAVKAKTATMEQPVINKRRKRNNVDTKTKTLKPMQFLPQRPVGQQESLRKPAINGSGLTYHQIVAARRSQ